MSIILSMETFNKLEEKLGTDSAKQVYELAEAIFEEVHKKNEEKLEKYKLNFADEEYKGMSRREILAFKEDLVQRQEQNKEEFSKEVRKNIRKVTNRATALIIVSILNLALLLSIIYNIYGHHLFGN